jgi:hypothetical protein
MSVSEINGKAELELAMQDCLVTGTGVMLGGKHIPIEEFKPSDSVTISRECYWAYVPQEEYWQTSCEEAFALNEGSPEDNNFKHCCYCGGKLKQALQTEES